MGACPPGLALVRIDTDGDFEPGNCLWGKPQRFVIRQPLAERFWRYVVRADPDDWSEHDICWLWTAATDSQGYGHLGGSGDRKLVAATHVALEIDGRPLAPGKMALHSCDRRNCVRFDHLREGTHAENMMDRAARGRTRHGPSGGKLTPDQVRAVRVAVGRQVEIAAQFGISLCHLRLIRWGRAWKRLTGDNARDGTAPVRDGEGMR